MKTNFEKTIKKQLKNRELEVSENAWERLTHMMDEEIPNKRGMGESTFSKRKLWIPVSIAASILLFFTIYLMNGNQNSEIPAENILVISEKENDKFDVKEAESLKVIEEKEVEAFVHSDKDSKNSTKKLENNSTKSIENKILPIPSESEIVFEKEVEFKENKIEIIEPKIELALQSDSVDKKEKTNFVDPEMLLYSIENNQSVKQNNADSRLVIIDFNK